MNRHAEEFCKNKSKREAAQSLERYRLANKHKNNLKKGSICGLTRFQKRQPRNLVEANHEKKKNFQTERWQLDHKRGIQRKGHNASLQHVQLRTAKGQRGLLTCRRKAQLPVMYCVQTRRQSNSQGGTPGTNISPGIRQRTSEKHYAYKKKARAQQRRRKTTL